MARKQFVSSKKNAPHRIVSTKDAALQERESGDVLKANEHVEIGKTIVSSPVSSGHSSSVSSIISDEEEDDLTETSQSIAMEVLPSAGGRGKQLRFPLAVHENDPSVQSSGGMSDSESYASITSEDEDENLVTAEPVAVTKDIFDGERSDSKSEDCAVEVAEVRSVTHTTETVSIAYPIKANRARKRVRPNSTYMKHMATYVCDCLLSVRIGGMQANVFSPENQQEFKRQLERKSVNRIDWAEMTRKAEEMNAEPIIDKAKKTKRLSRKKSNRKERKSSKSKGKIRVTGKSAPEESKVETLTSTKSVNAKTSDTNSKPTKNLIANGIDECSEETKTSGKEIDQAKKNDTLSKSNPASATESKEEPRVKESNPKAADPPIDRESSAVVCKCCKRKLEGTKNDTLTPSKKEKLTLEAASTSSFTIIFKSGLDLTKLRTEASQLNEQARKLKHEGNRLGGVNSEPSNQISQGILYLRASAKFFEHALKLAQIKAIYREQNDLQHARTYGEYCITTLSQTCSLIESTIRTFKIVNNLRMMAIGYKMAAIVHLAIYRLQHLKLYSFYCELFTPSGSPDSRQNGATPPLNMSANGSHDTKELTLKKHLLKEMEHLLRGFDMWRRYECCNTNVLEQFTDPATADLTKFLEQLEREFGQASCDGR